MSKRPSSPPARPAFDASVLGWAVPSSRLDLFRRLFAVKIAVFDTLDTLYGQTVPITQQGLGPLAVALLTPLACALAFRDRSARLGLFALAGLRAAGLALTLPFTINHMLLELVLLLGLALSFRGPADPAREAEALAATRWAQVLFLSVWFYAGVQKLVRGYYLNGELFGLEAFADDRGLTLGLSGAVGLMMLGGAALLGGTVPHVSAATLTDRAPLELAPWMAPFLIGLSTFIVALELVVPLLFLWPRRRRLAVVLLGLAQVGIALSSMEIDFAIDNFLFLLLLWPGRAAPWEAPVGGAARFRAISLGLLLLWPPLHMVLSPTLGFSSWRLFGWGMYATPDLWRLPAVYLEAEGAEITVIPTPERTPALMSAYKSLHYFPRPGAAAAYARAHMEGAGQTGAEALVLVLTRPRLDLSASALYTESEVFRVRGEQVDRLGTFSTENASYEASLREILARP